MLANKANRVQFTARLDRDLHHRMTLLVRGIKDSGKPGATFNDQLDAAVRAYLSGEVAPCSFPDATAVEAKKLANYLAFLRHSDPALLNLVDLTMRKLKGFREP
jgi:hypothetical protein